MGRPRRRKPPGMLVHEQYRKCIAFLCLPDAKTGWKPVGTAFFVWIAAGETGAPPTVGDPRVLYLVTARHVVEGARRFGPLYVRLNRRETDGTEFAQIDSDAWFVAQDTDVAVVDVPPQIADAFDIHFLRPTQVATAEVLSERRVGPGDEVFFSGLFTSFPGAKRAEPLIRFGTISMMPNEPVRIENADKSKSSVEAFLVEARSWGGQSGSPAFVFFPPDRQPGFLTMGKINTTGDGELLVPDHEMPQLLGLVQGHFDLKADVAFANDSYGSAHVPLNAGVAVVIPAQKIVDTLMEEELVEARKQIEDERPAATADAGQGPEAADEFQRFENLTDKLVKVPKRDVDEKREEES